MLSPAQQACFVVPRTSEELYDVELDPYQLMNIAADPKYAGILQQMRNAGEEWARRTQDEIPGELTPDRFDRETGARL